MAVNFLYITAGSAKEAREIARLLIKERLVACANIIDRIRSLYWWDGEVKDEAEAVLIVKTTADRVEAVVARVKALHSYDCPCVVALPIEGGNPDFLDWIASETAAAGKRS